MMENISFILWMVIYPYSVALTSYLKSKEKKVNGEKPFSDQVVLLGALYHLCIWLIIGSLLYK